MWRQRRSGSAKSRSGQSPNSAAGLCAATLCVEPGDRRGRETGGHSQERDLRGRAGRVLYSRFTEKAILCSCRRCSAQEVPVWVIGFDRDRAAAVEASNAIQQILHGRGNLIAICGKSDPAFILEAMRAGCGEYLSQPVAIEQLAEALNRVRTRLSVQKPPSPKPMGHILALLGARGGAGATTLAVHLGCFLVKQYGKKTLILDEHRRLGHVSLYLGEDEANYHFYELVQNIARLDETLLQGFVIHHSSCLDILPSPDCFDDSANVSLDDIQRAIRFLGRTTSSSSSTVHTECITSAWQRSIAVTSST